MGKVRGAIELYVGKTLCKFFDLNYAVQSSCQTSQTVMSNSFRPIHLSDGSDVDHFSNKDVLTYFEANQRDWK